MEIQLLAQRKQKLKITIDLKAGKKLIIYGMVRVRINNKSLTPL
jgi:hypothetical protein